MTASYMENATLPVIARVLCETTQIPDLGGDTNDCLVHGECYAPCRSPACCVKQLRYLKHHYEGTQMTASYMENTTLPVDRPRVV